MVRLLSLIKSRPVAFLLALLLLASVYDSFKWRTIADKRQSLVVDLNDVITEQNNRVSQIQSECRVKTTAAVTRAVGKLKPVQKEAKNAEEFNEWLKSLF